MREREALLYFPRKMILKDLDLLQNQKKKTLPAQCFLRSLAAMGSD